MKVAKANPLSLILVLAPLSMIFSATLTGCGALSKRENATSGETPASPGITAAEKDRRLMELETSNQTLLAKIESLESQLRESETRTESQKSVATPSQRKSQVKIPTVDVSSELFGARVEATPDIIVQGYQQAKVLFDSKKYPESILGFSSFVEKYSAHVLAGLAQFYLAEAYFLQGEYALSEQEYMQLIQKYPHSPMISFGHQRLGLALRQQGKTREAEASENLVQTLFPGSPAAYEVSRQKSMPMDKTPATDNGIPPTVDPLTSEKS